MKDDDLAAESPPCMHVTAACDMRHATCDMTKANGCSKASPSLADKHHGYPPPSTPPPSKTPHCQATRRRTLAPLLLGHVYQ